MWGFSKNYFNTNIKCFQQKLLFGSFQILNCSIQDEICSQSINTFRVLVTTPHTINFN
jgi:hypothetical protein